MNRPILILHGWGTSGKKYNELQKLLEAKKFKVFSPDLPGFGSESLKKDMTLSDYAEFVRSYLKKKRIEKPIIIAHSFGSRVAAKLAVESPDFIHKLVITGSPLIRQPLSVRKKVFSLVARIGKGITPSFARESLRKVLYRGVGEVDYLKAGKLSETFKNVVNEDLKNILHKISAPTLIVWGKNDTFVPLRVGKNIAEKIKSSTLKVVDGTHKLPYENPKLFFETIFPFTK